MSIKIFLSDVDGVLTDGGIYYTESGDEFKKFNCYDGMGMKLLQEKGYKVGIITSEDKQINRNRARKLKLDFDLLSNVGVCACPKNAVSKIKNIPNIKLLNSCGGNGAFREFADTYIK